MLSPVNSANALIDLLIALQNNSIANSLSNTASLSQNITVSSSASLNNSQNTLCGIGNDSHGSGTSLNSTNSFMLPLNSGNVNRQMIQSNNVTMSNGRCHQPPDGGSIV